MNRRLSNKGFLISELIVALSILAFLFVIFGTALGGFRSINHYYLSRQRCIAAAQAQLDSINVTGKPIEPERFKELWSKVNCSVDTAAGTDQWQGLTLVKVVAEAETGGRIVKIELSRYIAMPEVD